VTDDSNQMFASQGPVGSPVASITKKLVGRERNTFCEFKDLRIARNNVSDLNLQHTKPAERRLELYRETLENRFGAFGRWCCIQCVRSFPAERYLCRIGTPDSADGACVLVSTGKIKHVEGAMEALLS
jgi:hypothetical protein